LVLAVRRRAAADDGGGDVGAVPDVVLGVGRVAEVLLLENLAGQVRMGVVDAGVQDSHGDPGPVVPGGPGGGGADLRDALAERHLALAVEPDPGDTGGRGALGRAAGRDVGPEV